MPSHLPGLLRTARPLTPRLLRTSLLPKPLSTTLALRRLSSTPTKAYAAKQSQDKDSLNPVGTEYSKSGGDAEAAHEDTAFDGSKTTPEEELGDSTGKKGEDGSSLQVSPANDEVSKPRPAGEGGAQRSAKESKGERPQSGAGSPPKGGSMGKGAAGGGGSA